PGAPMSHPLLTPHPRGRPGAWCRATARAHSRTGRPRQGSWHRDFRRPALLRQRRPATVLQLLTPWVPPLNCETQGLEAGLNSSGDSISACNAARSGGGDCSRQNAPTKMVMLLSFAGLLALGGSSSTSSLA